MTSDPFDRGRAAPRPDDVGGDAPRPAVAPRTPPTRTPLAVPLAPTAPRPAGVNPQTAGPRRADDRRIVMLAIVASAGFLVAAALAALAAATGPVALSPWLPLHLALAGGASTAIAGVMPFFVAALAASPPAGARLRASAVLLVAIGAALVAARGIDPSIGWAPVVGGSMYLAGIGAVALAVRASGRAGLMMRRPVVSLGYMLALVNVAIGGLLGTLLVAGWPPVLEAWSRLRPAHAWTNVLGFVSLVILATLLHLLPTVLGGRIIPRRTTAFVVLGPGMGSPLVVLGLIAGSGPIAGAGAVLTLVGAGAMAIETAGIVRDRGRWTSDPGWHRFASVGMLIGLTWYLAGAAVAAWLVIARGPTAGAWSTTLVGAPLAAGWVAGILVASWTHLLPSVGPGGPVAHARQRVILGRLATPRLIAFNAGVALLWWGSVAELPSFSVGGGILAGAGLVVSVALALEAVRVGRGGS